MLADTGGYWSAPLDDVFIHFDYARATARGAPFSWREGDGYSSGNTSILYPFLLAPGFLLGLRDERIMIWAAVIAATCVFGMLLVTRTVFVRTLGSQVRSRVLSYIIPPLFFGVGALDWSLWSGMEVALFLGTWALSLLALFSLIDGPANRFSARASLLGLCGALMVLVRPEASTTIAAFGLAAILALRNAAPPRRLMAILVTIGAPAALVLLAQAIANRVLTGEWSANGAIVKLTINNPFLTRADKVDDYFFNLTYEVRRLIEHHFSDAIAYGFILPALAVVPLAFRSTRLIATLLWLQVISWLVIVAFNNQVRWQNERYIMPAVAWIVILACFGVALLLRDVTRRSPIRSAVKSSLAVAAVTLWIVHQAPKMRDQVGFFARACRNIRDQHWQAGKYLVTLNPRRVLVGDAGALMYASDKPGLDIIGLGGYHDLPFARAGINGLAASMELLERIPAGERPDFMAIYPGWWGVLSSWFAKRELARFPAEGNVICGGYEKVIYQTDWSLLGTGDAPRNLHASRVIDDIDVADLVSESEHRYSVSGEKSGWTTMKVLPDPRARSRNLFDAGRTIFAGESESFDVFGGNAATSAQLIFRTAPSTFSRVRLAIDGHEVEDGTIQYRPGSGWFETEVELPREKLQKKFRVTLFNDGPGEFSLYHVWLVQ